MDEIKDNFKREDLDALDQTKALVKPITKKIEPTFEDSLITIQRAAAELVNLQEAYKENGRLNDDQKKKYSESLEKLGVSAQKLAHVQDNEDDYRQLFEDFQADRVKGGSKKKPDNVKFPPYAKKPQVPAKKEECGEEENVGEEGDTNPSTTTTKAPSTTGSNAPSSTESNDPDDTVSVSSPDNEEDESSVAEAKPVGLAIAGEGGVASCKKFHKTIYKSYLIYDILNQQNQLQLQSSALEAWQSVSKLKKTFSFSNKLIDNSQLVLLQQQLPASNQVKSVHWVYQSPQN